jgi:hypothetical protein
MTFLRDASAAHSDPTPRPAPSPATSPADTDSWVIVVLSDTPHADAQRAGILHPIPGDLLDVLRIRVPVDVTEGVWRECVVWTVADTRETGNNLDQAGRLGDLLWATHQALFAQGPRTVSAFPIQLDRVRRDRLAGLPERVQILAVVTAADDDRPALTLMWPEEFGLLRMLGIL